MKIELIKLANELDRRGLLKEADYLDLIIVKFAVTATDSTDVSDLAAAAQGAISAEEAAAAEAAEEAAAEAAEEAAAEAAEEGESAAEAAEGTAPEGTTPTSFRDRRRTRQVAERPF